MYIINCTALQLGTDDTAFVEERTARSNDLIYRL